MGLTFRLLDDTGNKVGKPIKASAFYMKPTLTNLEGKFKENESQRAPYSKRLQTTIDWILNKQPASLEDFIEALEKENISTILRKGKEDVVYGITYIDHKTKCVFNGSDLGKEYSAKAIMEKCREGHQLRRIDLKGKHAKSESTELLQKKIKISGQPAKEQPGKLIELVSAPVKTIDYMPYQLLKKKKRKKKRISIC